MTPFIAELINHATGEIVIIEDPDSRQLVELGYSQERADEIAAYVIEYYKQLYFYELAWRQKELLNTDYYFMPDVELTEEQRTLLISYRQKLRDYPRQNLIPYRRPNSPTWIKMVNYLH